MAQTVKFEYTNHEGKTAVRTVMADRVVWLDEPGFGYTAGFFLTGVCLDRKAVRSFKLDPAHMRQVPGEPFGYAGFNILVTVR